MSSVPGQDSELKPEPGSLERLAHRLNDTEKYPRWLIRMRQLAILGLGIWIIVHSVTATSKNIAYIITGLILIGIIPVETLLLAVSKRVNKRDE